MPGEITRETLQALAAANGLSLPEKRLERVWKQYQIYLRLLARLDAFDLKMEAEPQTIVTLLPEAPPERRGRKGEPHGHR